MAGDQRDTMAVSAGTDDSWRKIVRWNRSDVLELTAIDGLERHVSHWCLANEVHGIHVANGAQQRSLTCPPAAW